MVHINFIDFFAAAGKGAKTTTILPLIERLQKQEFDLVAVGRALLWRIRPGQAKRAISELILFNPGAEKTLS
jgi:hypothetical protein